VSGGRRVRRDGLPAMLLFVAVPFAALFLAMGAHPAGLIDTEDEIRSRADRIYAVTIESRVMPLGNLTGMTEAERALVGRWARQAQ